MVSQKRRKVERRELDSLLRFSRLTEDTVKQAEVFAEIRAQYDIERDDNLQLREFPTLAHVVGFVRERRPDQPAAATRSVMPSPEPAAAPAPDAAVVAASGDQAAVR